MSRNKTIRELDFQRYEKIFRLTHTSISYATVQLVFLFNYLLKLTSNTYWSLSLYWSGMWDYYQLGGDEQVSLIRRFNNQQDSSENIIRVLTNFSEKYEQALEEGELRLIRLYVRLDIPYEQTSLTADKLIHRVFPKIDNLMHLRDILHVSPNWKKMTKRSLRWVKSNKPHIRGYITQNGGEILPILSTQLMNLLNKTILIIMEDYNILQINIDEDNSIKPLPAETEYLWTSYDQPNVTTLTHRTGLNLETKRRGRPKLTSDKIQERLELQRHTLLDKLKTLSNGEDAIIQVGRGRPKLSERERIIRTLLRVEANLEKIGVELTNKIKPSTPPVKPVTAISTTFRTRGRPRLTDKEVIEKLISTRLHLKDSLYILPEHETVISREGRGRPKLSERDKIVRAIFKIETRLENMGKTVSDKIEPPVKVSKPKMTKTRGKERGRPRLTEKEVIEKLISNRLNLKDSLKNLPNDETVIIRVGRGRPKLSDRDKLVQELFRVETKLENLGEMISNKIEPPVKVSKPKMTKTRGERVGRPRLTENEVIEKLVSNRLNLMDSLKNLPDDETVIIRVGRGRPKLSERDKLIRKISNLESRLEGMGVEIIDKVKMPMNLRKPSKTVAPNSGNRGRPALTYAERVTRLENYITLLGKKLVTLPDDDNHKVFKGGRGRPKLTDRERLTNQLRRSITELNLLRLSEDELKTDE